MKQGMANLAEDYCFIHKALRPVTKARRKIAAVPSSNSRPVNASNQSAKIINMHYDKLIKFSCL